MDTRKQIFVKEFNEKISNIHYLVLAIKLPNGAIELITNTMDFQEKYNYIISTYDKDMRMYNNNRILILDWMMI